MKTRILVILVLYLPVTPAHFLICQEDVHCQCPEVLSAESALAGELFLSTQPVDPITFYNQDWLTGDLTLINGEIIRNKVIKYNGMLDEVFWLEPESKRTILLDKEAIEHFSLFNAPDGPSVCFRKIKVKPDMVSDSTEVFGQEIYAGKISLYVLHLFTAEKKERFEYNGGTYQRPVYQAMPVYYFRFQDKRTVGLKDLNRKGLFAALPDFSDQIKIYLRDNRPVTTWDQDELAALVKFLGESSSP